MSRWRFPVTLRTYFTSGTPNQKQRRALPCSGSPPVKGSFTTYSSWMLRRGRRPWICMNSVPSWTSTPGAVSDLAGNADSGYLQTYPVVHRRRRYRRGSWSRPPMTVLLPGRSTSRFHEPTQRDGPTRTLLNVRDDRRPAHTSTGISPSPMTTHWTVVEGHSVIFRAECPHQATTLPDGLMAQPQQLDIDTRDAVFDGVRQPRPCPTRPTRTSPL